MHVLTPVHILCMFMDRDRIKVHKHTKKNNSNIRTKLLRKDLLLCKKENYCWVGKMGLSSQSQQSIQFILPTKVHNNLLPAPLSRAVPVQYVTLCLHLSPFFQVCVINTTLKVTCGNLPSPLQRRKFVTFQKSFVFCVSETVVRQTASAQTYQQC